jgi:hypothetical protein
LSSSLASLRFAAAPRRSRPASTRICRWAYLASMGRYALTGAGCRRISAGGRAPGTILSFRKRDVLGSGVQHRKPASGNPKE